MKDNNNLFYVIFENNTCFKGGENYKDTLWKAIPNKPIKRIFYKTPYNDHICLSGYQRYYHIIEATMDLSGKNKGKENIEYAYIMGHKRDKVISYRISLMNNVGNISCKIFDKESNFIKGLNKQGWKTGIK